MSFYDVHTNEVYASSAPYAANLPHTMRHKPQKQATLQTWAVEPQDVL